MNFSYLSLNPNKIPPDLTFAIFWRFFNGKEKNKDLGKNRHGALLLDFCKGNNMFILNGRLNGDKDGNFTCKGTNVVDYCISNLNKFHCLKVSEFSSFLR
jgi:hypothetical protein